MIAIRMRRKKGGGRDEAVVRVTDGGVGAPADALEKLFKPFYRLDDARGRQTGGVGLGLAITDRAVRLHGGTIRGSNPSQGGLMGQIRPSPSSLEASGQGEPQPVTKPSLQLSNPPTPVSPPHKPRH